MYEYIIAIYRTCADVPESNTDSSDRYSYGYLSCTISTNLYSPVLIYRYILQYIQYIHRDLLSLLYKIIMADRGSDIISKGSGDSKNNAVGGEGTDGNRDGDREGNGSGHENSDTILLEMDIDIDDENNMTSVTKKLIVRRKDLSNTRELAQRFARQHNVPYLSLAIEVRNSNAIILSYHETTIARVNCTS